jgi:hypothetical protein
MDISFTKNFNSTLCKTSIEQLEGEEQIEDKIIHIVEETNHSLSNYFSIFCYY